MFAKTLVVHFARVLLILLMSAAVWAEPIVGRPLPSWEGLRWLEARPSLEGRVVLVRYFTEGCSLCKHTVPSLLRLEREFPRLLVIGVYHPKPRGPVNAARVKQAAQGLHIDFPVAWDADWKVLQRWWLDRSEGDYTSVSFLLDAQGVVRWVHPGGEVPPDSSDFKELRAQVGRLLSRP